MDSSIKTKTPAGLSGPTFCSEPLGPPFEQLGELLSVFGGHHGDEQAEGHNLEIVRAEGHRHAVVVTLAKTVSEGIGALRFLESQKLHLGCPG